MLRTSRFWLKFFIWGKRKCKYLFICVFVGVYMRVYRLDIMYTMRSNHRCHWTLKRFKIFGLNLFLFMLWYGILLLCQILCYFCCWYCYREYFSIDMDRSPSCLIGLQMKFVLSLLIKNVRYPFFVSFFFFFLSDLQLFWFCYCISISLLYCCWLNAFCRLYLELLPLLFLVPRFNNLFTLNWKRLFLFSY